MCLFHLVDKNLDLRQWQRNFWHGAWVRLHALGETLGDVGSFTETSARFATRKVWSCFTVIFSCLSRTPNPLETRAFMPIESRYCNSTCRLVSGRIAQMPSLCPKRENLSPTQRTDRADPMKGKTQRDGSKRFPTCETVPCYQYNCSFFYGRLGQGWLAESRGIGSKPFYEGKTLEIWSAPLEGVPASGQGGLNYTRRGSSTLLSYLPSLYSSTRVASG